MKRLLLLFILCAGFCQGLQAEPNSRPEFLLRKAARFLPEYLQLYHEHFAENRPLVSELTALAYELSYGQQEQLKFVTDQSIEFTLPGESIPRDAVTASTATDPIFFNLPRLIAKSDFTYESALRLLVHELGHKVKLVMSPPPSQDEIDQLAVKLSTFFSRQAFEDQSFLIVNGPSYLEPFSLLHQIKNSGFLTFTNSKGQFFDLTVDLFKQIEDLLPQRRAWIDRNRSLRQIEWLKPLAEGTFHGLFQVVAVRQSKDPSFALVSDVSITHSYQAEFELNPQTSPPQLKLLSYKPIEKPLRRVPDARLFLKNVSQNSKGHLEGDLDLQVNTEFNFHSGQVPEHRSMELILFYNGQSLHVPITLHPAETKSWYQFPGEIYKTLTHKEGRFTAQLPAQIPKQFDIVGATDLFFELGGRGPGFAQPRLIRLDQTVHVTSCDGLLTSVF